MLSHGSRYQKSILVIMVCLCLNHLGNVPVAGQHSAKKKQTKVNPAGTIGSKARWMSLLDSLAKEARLVLPEKRRPFALAEVADAYWNFDSQVTRDLLVAAMDAAVSLQESKEDKKSAINHVLKIAVGRDAAFARKLTERIVDKQGAKGDPEEISLSVALSLLKQDAGRAAQLAETVAPSGLSSVTAAYFPLQLAKQDVALANRVYATYLSKFAADENLPLNSLLSFGGYAFGYSEFYGLDSSTPPQKFGASFRQIEGLSSNPTLAAAYLNLAFQRTRKAVLQAAEASGTEKDVLNIIVLFTFEYLSPEVAKFQPGAISQWEQLRQQAIPGTTTTQYELVAQHIKSINEARARVKRFDDAPQLSPEQEAQENLDKAEKLTASCQKNREFGKAALRIGSTQDFKRALSVADRISDTKQRDTIRQFIFYDMASAAAKVGDWLEAREAAKAVFTPELRAALLVRTAEAAIRRKDRALGGELLMESVKNAEQVSEAEVRAGLLFAVAAVQIKADPLEGLEILRRAVKAVNQQTTKDPTQFSIPMKISFSCDGEDDSWYGAPVSLANASASEALSLFSQYNIEETLLVAQNLEDQWMKIRAIASILKSIPDQKIAKVL
jgi:hypothetical protein